MANAIQLRADRWWSRLLHNRLLLNLLTWALVFGLLFLATQFDPEETTLIEVFSVILAICLIIALPVYATNYIARPQWQKGRRLLSIGIYLVIVFLSAWLSVYIMYAFAGTACYGFVEDCDLTFEDVNQLGYYNALSTIIIGTLIAISARYARDSLIRNNEQRAAELQLLKAQLNPHFLFNTVNNLYGLAVIQSDKLPDLMLQLSDLLRYSLYDTREPWVPLEKEIAYIKNYIDLERVRLDESTVIDYQQAGEPSGQRIVPMLLIVFLENAFKHFSAAAGENAEIRVKLSIVEQQMHFSCYNTKDPENTLPQRPDEVGGIGLANVRKRLDFIYGKSYRLGIQNEAAAYNVFLEIPLEKYDHA